MPTFARLNQRNKTSATRDIEIRGLGARSATRIELPIPQSVAGPFQNL